MVPTLAFLLGGNGGFAPPNPSSPGAERIADVYYLIAAFAGAIFLIVTVPLLVFAVRFRSRGRARTVEGPQIRGNTNLELAWTVAPVLILFVIGGFVFYKLPGIVTPAKAEPVALRVHVEGRQFYWRYVYPNGVIAVDRLRLPLDETVEVEITAPRGDVIHSFWVPELGGKRDAIPGITTSFEVKPDTLGVFKGKCAEFCGIQHAKMLLEAEVLPQAEFQLWLDREAARQRSDPLALGGQIWSGVCSKCHGPDVAGKIGPPLQGNPIVADANAVRTVVTNGRGKMPAVGQGWTERELEAITTYLKQRVASGG